MTYGTSYFKSVKSAVRYYSAYEPDPEEAVQRKLAEGQIHIGKPTLGPGERLLLIDDGTRYAITDDVLTPTRNQYLNHEVTHEEYYRAIAETAGIRLGPDHPLVKQALTSTDEHYNDIPLTVWDSYFPFYRMQLQKALKVHADTGEVSLSDNTCTLKQAVRDAIARIPKEITAKVNKLDAEQWQ